MDNQHSMKRFSFIFVTLSSFSLLPFSSSYIFLNFIFFLNSLLRNLISSWTGCLFSLRMLFCGQPSKLCSFFCLYPHPILFYRFVTLFFFFRLPMQAGFYSLMTVAFKICEKYRYFEQSELQMTQMGKRKFHIF